MKAAIIISAIFALLLVLAVQDLGTGAKRASPPPLFGCRAPTAEGEITMITIDVRAGKLVGECDYASTRQSKPKRKGG